MKFRFSNCKDYAVEFDAFDPGELERNALKALVEFESERPNAYMGGECELHVYDPTGDAYAWQKVPTPEGGWRGRQKSDVRRVLPLEVNWPDKWASAVRIYDETKNFHASLNSLIGQTVEIIDDHLVLSADTLE